VARGQAGVRTRAPADPGYSPLTAQPPATHHLPPTTHDRPPTTDYSLREAVLQAVMYSLGLVLGLKAIIKVLLWCLRGRGGGQDEAGGDKAEAREKAE